MCAERDVDGTRDLLLQRHGRHCSSDGEAESARHACRSRCYCCPCRCRCGGCSGVRSCCAIVSQVRGEQTSVRSACTRHQESQSLTGASDDGVGQRSACAMFVPVQWSAYTDRTVTTMSCVTGSEMSPSPFISSTACGGCGPCGLPQGVRRLGAGFDDVQVLRAAAAVKFQLPSLPTGPALPSCQRSGSPSSRELCVFLLSVLCSG